MLGDLLRGLGHRGGALMELDNYVRKPRLSGPRVVGLEGLLTGSPDTPSLRGEGGLVLSALQSAASSPAPLGFQGAVVDPLGGAGSLAGSLTPGPST